MLLYEEAYLQAQKEIGAELRRSPLLVRTYLGHLAQAQGKNIRAACVLAAAQNADGAVPEAGIQAAVAIELVHLASLVHDDIIDDSDLRRGQPSLQKQFGKGTAVICGDYLLALALKILMTVPRQSRWPGMNIPDYLGRLCLGELNQHVNQRNTALSVSTYLKIISGKTAALFEAAFFAGAVLAELPEDKLRAMKRFGHTLGMIFQLSDDCLDFEADEDEAKKPVQTDFENGVITLPLIHAFACQPELRQLAGNGRLSRERLNEAVKEADGLGYTRWFVERYYRKAERALDTAQLPQGQRERLMTLLRRAARRRED